VTVAELTAGLIWPKLLRAAGLSLAPSRLAIGFAVAFLIAAWSWLIDYGWPTATFEPIAIPAFRSLSAALVEACTALLYLAPAYAALELYQQGLLPFFEAVGREPFRAAVWLIPSVALLAIGSGAIARSVAVDVAGDLSLGVRGSLAFAIKRWRSMVFAVFIPLIVAGLIALVLAIAGWALLSLKGVSVLGALLLGPAFLAGLLLVIIFAVFLVGHSMLTPAVAVESTDAADAVQRAYAYALGKPGRLLIYGLVLLAQGALALIVIRFLTDQAWSITQDLTAAWLSRDRAEAIHSRGAQGPTASIVRAWPMVFALIPAAWLISYSAAGGTLLYLLLRRVNDEQDIREIWMPGMIPGTLAGPEPARAAASVTEPVDL